MAGVWRSCSEPVAGDPSCELAVAGKRGSASAGTCSDGAGRGNNVSAWASGPWRGVTPGRWISGRGGILGRETTEGRWILGRGVTEGVGTPGRGATEGGGILGRETTEGRWILGRGVMEGVGTPGRGATEGEGILGRETTEGMWILGRGVTEGVGTPGRGATEGGGNLGRETTEGRWILGRGVTEGVGTPGRGARKGGGILGRGSREGGGTLERWAIEGRGTIGREGMEGGGILGRGAVEGGVALGSGATEGEGILGKLATEGVRTPGRGATERGGILGRETTEGRWILGRGVTEGVGTPGRGATEGGGVLGRWTREGGRVSPGCQVRGCVGTGAIWCLVLGRFGLGRSNLSPVSLEPACSQVTNALGRWPLRVVGLQFLSCCTWAPGATIALAREGWFGSSARRSWPHLWAKPTHGHLQPGPWARAVSTGVPRDVLLFQHHRPAYFRLLGIFCGAQSLFWAYLAIFAFTSLKDTGCKDSVLVGDQAQGLPKIGGMALNLGADKWRYGFTTSCLTMGSLILAAGVVFARRSVCGVLLHQGGKEVTISSHGLLGGTRSFRAPLRDLSCVAHRGQVASFVPLRVRGHRLYYLLDRRGQFFNPRLFDVTVGAFRKL